MHEIMDMPVVTQMPVLLGLLLSSLVDEVLPEFGSALINRHAMTDDLAEY